MSRMHGFWHRVYVALSGERYTREIERELRFHLELERMAQGADGSVEAELAARRALGNVTYYREEVRRMTALGWFDRMGQNATFAVRGLRRSPGLAITVVATLALGLGVNAAMFSLLDRVFSEPPAGVVDPGHVYRLYVDHRGAQYSTIPIYAGYAYPQVRAILAAAPPTVQMAAYSTPDSIAAIVANERVPVQRSYVGSGYFTLLGIRAERGRLFAPEELRIETPAHVAVLSDGFWHRVFDGRSDAIGSTIRMGDKPYTIIGVAGASFTGVDLDVADVWTPANTVEASLGGFLGAKIPWYENFGMPFRLLMRAPSPAEESGALGSSTAAFRTVHIRGLMYDSLPKILDGPIVEAAGPMLATREVQVSTRAAGVSVIVLLVACANVVNLLLLRGSRRRREIAVRRALGVSRWRLYEQLAVESVILFVLGGAVAVGVAMWTGALARHLMLPRVHWGSAAVDGRTLLFIAGLSLAIGLLAGLAPALHAARPDLVESLKAGSRDSAYQRSRIRSALVVAQTALCVLLVVGAGLFVRSLSILESIDVGLDVPRLEMLSPTFAGAGSHDAVLSRALPQAAERIRRLPGVLAVGMAQAGPMSGYSFGPLSLPGRDSLPALPGQFGASYNNVSPDYFAATGIRIVAGRTFTTADRFGNGKRSGSVIVGESMAKLYWPRENPIGRCVILGGANGACSTVVGVASDAHRMSIVEHSVLQYYQPLDTNAAPRVLLVRADPSRLAVIAREANDILMHTVPGIDANHIQRMSQVLAPELRPWHLGATLFTAFGILALVIAGVGVYSIASYSVAQRTHELGVRMALGARISDIMELVIGEGLALVGAGVVVGLVAAYFMGRLVRALLFGVTPTDPSVMLVATVTLCVLAVVACAIPGIRAARVDPASALRSE